MGTTVSALVLVDDQAVDRAHRRLAHLPVPRRRAHPDHRPTTPSCSASSTAAASPPEEAAVHPRRSVLMRVLGDVDPTPRSTRSSCRPSRATAGCSAPTACRGVVDDAHIAKRARPAASTPRPYGRQPAQAEPRRRRPRQRHRSSSSTSAGSIRSAHGTPDRSSARRPNPLGFEVPAARPGRAHAGCTCTARRANEPSHFEPDRRSYLEELIEEDRRRARRRRHRLDRRSRRRHRRASSARAARSATSGPRRRYFVGADDGTVAIYQGIQQDIGPITLSTVYEDTDIELDRLCRLSTAQQVERTITRASLEDAERIVDRLQRCQRRVDSSDHARTPATRRVAADTAVIRRAAAHPRAADAAQPRARSCSSSPASINRAAVALVQLGALGAIDTDVPAATAAA